MTEMQSTLADLASARDQVTSTASSLKGEQTSLHTSMEDFLGSGWTGTAAQQFADAWGDWNTAAGEILDGLNAMAGLLDNVRVDFTGTDDGTGQNMARLTARLGPS